VIKAELKRCISIERRWNRNEVSRGSADKEGNRRPTSLKKFTADALLLLLLLLLLYTQGEVTPQNLRSRYDRHFVGITWHIVWS